MVYCLKNYYTFCIQGRTLGRSCWKTFLIVSWLPKHFCCYHSYLRDRLRICRHKHRFQISYLMVKLVIQRVLHLGVLMERKYLLIILRVWRSFFPVRILSLISHQYNIFWIYIFFCIWWHNQVTLGRSEICLLHSESWQGWGRKSPLPLVFFSPKKPSRGDCSFLGKQRCSSQIALPLH